MREAQFYKKSANNAVACELCSHYCRIKSGATGICGARQNIDGRLYSLVYSKPAAMNVDPMEKKPLFHFLPGSKTFSLGTLGCNFKCANCQNWEISQAFVETRHGASLRRPVSPRQIVAQAVASGCQSIAYTYNEPTIFTEYALDIMKLAKKNNLKNVWVSNGYMGEQCLKAILPYLDAANIDLKSFDEKFYLKNCGAKLAPILKNLISLKQAGVHLEITTLIIPGLSDDPAMLKKLAEFIVRELGSDTPWHVSRFWPEISWKLHAAKATPEQTVLQAHAIGKNAGLKYVYAGNLYNTDKENTYCPKCGELAIHRLGYDITRYDKDGHCAKCGLVLLVHTA
ncbi:MAG: AmmeMemoRadiSam system radical SAM enzyme [Patescibacteria group bacterium]|nr:AmmeMemoRadiSam system radical SAM enzyme [Patescibacteria group bacterium]